MAYEHKYEGFGLILDNLMKKADMNSSELAKAIGVHPAHISHYRRCKAKPSYETLRKLHDALGCTWEELMG